MYCILVRYATACHHRLPLGGPILLRGGASCSTRRYQKFFKTERVTPTEGSVGHTCMNNGTSTFSESVPTSAIRLTTSFCVPYGSFRKSGDSRHPGGRIPWENHEIKVPRKGVKSVDFSPHLYSPIDSGHHKMVENRGFHLMLFSYPSYITRFIAFIRT